MLPSQQELSISNGKVIGQLRFIEFDIAIMWEANLGPASVARSCVSQGKITELVFNHRRRSPRLNFKK